jgi:hypothetical protein
VSTSRESDAYREQLVRWCRALAGGRTEEVSTALAEGEAQDVARFLAQAVGERRELLRQELAFVALAFDDFDALLGAYLRQAPQRAYDPEHSDRERFVRWLQEARPLTTKEHQFVAYQQAEDAVAAEARKRRAEHLAFQRAWRQVGAQLPRLTRDPALRIHLNPIRAWSRLALPGRAAGDVLFFAAGDRVTFAAPGPLERAFVEVLARGPCTLAALADELGPVSREELASLCRGRAAEGLVAFE